MTPIKMDAIEFLETYAPDVTNGRYRDAVRTVCHELRAARKAITETAPEWTDCWDSAMRHVKEAMQRAQLAAIDIPPMPVCEKCGGAQWATNTRRLCQCR